MFEIYRDIKRLILMGVLAAGSIFILAAVVKIFSPMSEHQKQYLRLAGLENNYSSSDKNKPIAGVLPASYYEFPTVIRGK